MSHKIWIQYVRKVHLGQNYFIGIKSGYLYTLWNGFLLSIVKSTNLLKFHVKFCTPDGIITTMSCIMHCLHSDIH